MRKSYNLRIKGQLITPIDLFIAATAIYDFHFGNPIFCLNSIDSRTAISREILSLKD
jgi:hypothetical protein